MEKFRTCLLLALLFTVPALVYYSYAFSFGDATGGSWYNTSWHYRVRLEINSTVTRVNWPVEYHANFTSLLPSGTFDPNSTRIFEYSNAGALLGELLFQFDPDPDYSASTNAAGTLSFIMNGTSPAGSRIFYIYYDSIENGAKPAASYASTVNYTWSDGFFNVSTPKLNISVNTNSAGNTSGIAQVIENTFQNVIVQSAHGAQASEYVQLFNGTNTTAALAGNASFLQGPVKLVITQQGPEVAVGDATSGYFTKKYVFYASAGPESYGSFVKITVNFTNLGSEFHRNSTDSGALAIDADRTLSSASISTYDVNSTNPFSYAWASGAGGELVGIVQINQSTPNLSAAYSPALGRIGLTLNDMNFGPNTSVQYEAILYFGIGGSDGVTEFLEIKDGFASQPAIKQFAPEQLHVEVAPATSHGIYNRNETVVITANFTVSDPYNLTKFVNATIDSGTNTTADDFAVQMYDDGTHGDSAAGDRIFTGNFTLPAGSNATKWSATANAYDADYKFLNASGARFNVTTDLSMSLTISNPAGLADRLVSGDAVLKNFRNDTVLAGAAFECAFGSATIINKTDMSNGTYSFNFTAPDYQSDFTLQCNASKSSNFGSMSSQFATEAAKTGVNISAEPVYFAAANVVFASGEALTENFSAQNSGNGTAGNATVSLELPQNWSYSAAVNCGNINMRSGCSGGINITIPEGYKPGNYSYNTTVVWTNPDGTQAHNATQSNVTVFPNMLVSAYGNISAVAADGLDVAAGNFTIVSTGNAEANISISCLGGACQNFTISFHPAAVMLQPNSSAAVYVNVTVPLGFGAGDYSGTINVSASNSVLLLLNVTLQPKTAVNVSFSPGTYNASNITQLVNESFELGVSATNAGNSSATNASVSLALPYSWSASEAQACGNLTSMQPCARNFTVFVPAGTPAGNYSVNASVSWTDADGTNGFITKSMTVNVLLNRIIALAGQNITASISAGAEALIGNFTVLSVGNDAANNVSFSCASGLACQNFTVRFSPAGIDSIAANSSSAVDVSVTAPAGFLAGNYSGLINVSSDATSAALDLYVTVSANRTWSMSPGTCVKSQLTAEGTACAVTVLNSGNVEINFTVSPQSANHSASNETAFAVQPGASHTFSVSYNVTGFPEIYYNTTFVVGPDEQATPQFIELNVTLQPYIPPVINAWANESFVTQNSSISINANITDRSGLGISFATLNIAMPNGTVVTGNMSLVSQSGNLTRWTYAFQGTQRGSYNVSILSEDNTGSTGSAVVPFSVAARVSMLALTLTNAYLQGDTGTIFFIAHDFSGAGLQNVNTTIRIFDPSGNVSYSLNRMTNSDGTIDPMPTFLIASDSPVGNYTLIANSTFLDPVSNVTSALLSNSSFSVSQRTVTVTGLFADIETGVVWFPNNVMKFSMLTYNGQGTPTDPSTTNLTIYDPAGNAYFSVTSVSQLTRQGTGFYTYQYAMTPSTATGMYLAVLQATQGGFSTLKLKAFRVSQGGPYDVRLQLKDGSVSPGDQLGFTLFVENKGEVSQDVFVEYSIVDASNNTYYTGSEAVFTPSLANQSFDRTAPIFANQPFGSYTLRAKVRYDNVQPQIVANASFVVIQKAHPPPQPPPPPSVPPSAPITALVTIPPEPQPAQTGILISSYDKNVSLSRGFASVEHVTVTNSGNTVLSNISLVVLGVPSNWYAIKPSNYATLDPGNSSVFLVEFNVPKDADVGARAASLLVTTGTVSDQKSLIINVFQSTDELLQFEIDRTEKSYTDLLVDIRVAQNGGKDVSRLNVFTDDIQARISDAKVALRNSSYGTVYDDLNTAKTLISKAHEALDSMQVVSTHAEVISLWLVLSALAVIFGLAITVVVLWRKKIIRMPKIKLNLPKPPEKAKASPQPSNAELDRLIRMLNVLESERRDGIMTQHAYDEMKRTLQEKIKKLGKS